MTPHSIMRRADARAPARSPAPSERPTIAWPAIAMASSESARKFQIWNAISCGCDRSVADARSRPPSTRGTRRGSSRCARRDGCRRRRRRGCRAGRVAATRASTPRRAPHDHDVRERGSEFARRPCPRPSPRCRGGGRRRAAARAPRLPSVRGELDHERCAGVLAAAEIAGARERDQHGRRAEEADAEVGEGVGPDARPTRPSRRRPVRAIARPTAASASPRPTASQRPSMPCSAAQLVVAGADPARHRGRRRVGEEVEDAERDAEQRRPRPRGRRADRVPRCPTIAVSASTYSGSAASAPNAGSASRRISRSVRVAPQEAHRPTLGAGRRRRACVSFRPAPAAGGPRRGGVAELSSCGCVDLRGRRAAIGAAEVCRTRGACWRGGVAEPRRVCPDRPGTRGRGASGRALVVPAFRTPPKRADAVRTIRQAPRRRGRGGSSARPGARRRRRRHGRGRRAGQRAPGRSRRPGSAPRCSQPCSAADPLARSAAA